MEMKLDMLAFSTAQFICSLAISGMILVFLSQNLPFESVVGMQLTRQTFRCCISTSPFFVECWK